MLTRIAVLVLLLVLLSPPARAQIYPADQAPTGYVGLQVEDVREGLRTTRGKGDLAFTNRRKSRDTRPEQAEHRARAKAMRCLSAASCRSFGK